MRGVGDDPFNYEYIALGPMLTYHIPGICVQKKNRGPSFSHLIALMCLSPCDLFLTRFVLQHRICMKLYTVRCFQIEFLERVDTKLVRKHDFAPRARGETAGVDEVPLIAVQKHGCAHYPKSSGTQHCL